MPAPTPAPTKKPNASLLTEAQFLATIEEGVTREARERRFMKLIAAQNMAAYALGDTIAWNEQYLGLIDQILSAIDGSPDEMRRSSRT